MTLSLCQTVEVVLEEGNDNCTVLHSDMDTLGTLSHRLYTTTMLYNMQSVPTVNLQNIRSISHLHAPCGGLYR